MLAFAVPISSGLPPAPRWKPFRAGTRSCFANLPVTASGEPMPVASFLREARRLVVEFAVGRVLKSNSDIDEGAAGLDDITTYYLLHRDSFGLNDAPVGACILYAISCGLSGSGADRPV